MKAVVFGPFIGEFGWELLFWQGWVRRMCLNDFSEYWKIAISYPGRSVFYEGVDEFREIPRDLIAGISSPRNYICDYWFKGSPSPDRIYEWKIKSLLEQIFKWQKPHKIEIASAEHGDLSVRDFLVEYTQRLRVELQRFDEVTILSPWELIKNKNSFFGFDFNSGLDLGSPERAIPISFSEQTMIKIGNRVQEHIRFERPSLKKIAIFPRRRNIRRPDKNWSRENYLELIKLFKEESYEVAILGDNKGAYFVGEVLDGVVDLVNIPDSNRLEEQLAYLEFSTLAVGAMSGATLFALATGTPTLIFGYQEEKERYERENFLKTPMIYHQDMNPPPVEIFALSKKLISTLY